MKQLRKRVLASKPMMLVVLVVGWVAAVTLTSNRFWPSLALRLESSKEVGPSTTANWSLSNVGSRAVEVLQIRAPCGVQVVNGASRWLAVGETMRFELTYGSLRAGTVKSGTVFVLGQDSKVLASANYDVTSVTAVTWMPRAVYLSEGRSETVVIRFLRGATPTAAPIVQCAEGIACTEPVARSYSWRFDVRIDESRRASTPAAVGELVLKVNWPNNSFPGIEIPIVLSMSGACRVHPTRFMPVDGLPSFRDIWVSGLLAGDEVVVEQDGRAVARETYGGGVVDGSLKLTACLSEDHDPPTTVLVVRGGEVVFISEIELVPL